jgi:hypothetical protein
MCNIRSSAIDVKEPPPIRQASQQRPRVFVQAMVEVVGYEVCHEKNRSDQNPILKKQKNGRLEDHDSGYLLRVLDRET